MTDDELEREIVLATKEFAKLVRAGFSERFLRSECGNKQENRRFIANNPEKWRPCLNCNKKYAEIADNNRAQKINFCSFLCAGEYYKVPEDKLSDTVYAVSLAQSDDFYFSKAWRDLRYVVLQEQGARCNCCGNTAQDGVKLHVDHIKPKFYYPHLSLTKSNLQVLCELCNFGKGAWDETNWREGETA